MHFNNIIYLEDQDFTRDGKLNINIPNVPVVVMIQASWCPHCQHAAPAFQAFADSYSKKVICATIQGDGESPSEQLLSKRIKQINPAFMGFPDYMLFKNGVKVNKQITGRGVSDLIKFAS